MDTNQLIGFYPRGIILSTILIFVLVLVVTPIVLSMLLKKCDEEYLTYEGDQLDGVKIYLSIPQLLGKIFTKPRELVKNGEITSYSDEEYRTWLYWGLTVISILASLLVGELKFSLSMLMTIVFTPIGIAIGRWFFVGIQTVLFRYVAGIKLSYDEGKTVFGPIYMANFIANMVVSVLCNRLIYFLGSRNLMLSVWVSIISTLILFIWVNILFYLLLKYRYKLGGGESVIKLVIMSLVEIGFLVALVIIACIPMWLV